MSRKKLLVVLVLLLSLSLLAGKAAADSSMRVTGSGLVYDPSGALRIATISARIMPDGTVKGEGQGVLLFDDTLLVHTQIDCIRLFEMEGVKGKGAVLSGWATFTKNFPDYVPDPAYIVLAVFDAGEGKDSADIFSRAVPAPSPEALDCNDPFPYPLIPLEHGNVQVDW